MYFMRMVKKTKKYEVNNSNTATSHKEPKAETQYTKPMQDKAYYMTDGELLLAMEEAKEVKYDICTIAAMQHYIDSKQKV